MPQPNRRNSQKLDKAIEFVQARYSASALQRGSQVREIHPPAVASGFPQLDVLTGCNGIPLNHITLLSGGGRDITSGKLTLGYKILANAQLSSPSARRKHLVAAMSLNRTINPDYLIRCGVDVNSAAVLQPQSGGDAIHLIADVARSRRARALLVDSLPDLMADARVARRFEAAVGAISALVAQSNCALIFLDDPKPLWLRLFAALARDRSAVRQAAALHLALTHEAWIEHDGRLRGYRSRVEVVHSRWAAPSGRGARSGASAAIDILFNGTVKAAPTWR
jgi:recombination protein RecA